MLDLPPIMLAERGGDSKAKRLETFCFLYLEASDGILDALTSTSRYSAGGGGPGSKPFCSSEKKKTDISQAQKTLIPSLLKSPPRDSLGASPVAQIIWRNVRGGALVAAKPTH